MWNAGAEQIPKLTVRVRFPSPTPTLKAQFGSGFPNAGGSTGTTPHVGQRLWEIAAYAGGPISGLGRW